MFVAISHLRVALFQPALELCYHLRVLPPVRNRSSPLYCKLIYMRVRSLFAGRRQAPSYSPSRTAGTGHGGLWLLCACLCLLSPGLAAKPVSYQVLGVKGTLKDNVSRFLSTLPAIEPDRVESRREQIRLKADRALQALGYYASEIELEQSAEAPERVRVRITAGQPVRVRQFEVQLTGDALQDEEFARILARPGLKSGDVLDHGKYESIKSRLRARALARGYFDADFSIAEVRVYPEERVADVQVEFASGRRYRFGEVKIEGVTERARLVTPLIPFRTGDPYRAIQLGQLSQSLSETQYFQQVDVRPRIADARDYRVPVDIVLKPKSSNLVETGIGVSTDEGPRVQLNWEKPWVNKYGHRLNAQFKVSAPQQELNVGYRIPGLDPLNDYYLLQTGYVAKDLQDTNSSKTLVGLHYRTRKRGDWERDYFVRMEYEDYTQGLESGTSLLLLPGLSLNRLRTRGGLDPDWGDRQLLITEFSDPYWGSDSRFVRVWGRSKWLRAPSTGHRFIARAEQGGIWGDDLETIPPSLRFFTGGDQTVRGFSYQSLSPVDSAGLLTGGKYTTALSLEYAVPVAEKWRLASFVDTGIATSTYDEPWKIGTGLGVRWMTPVGQLRIDLAFGVSETQVPFRLHFAMGPEL